MKSTSVNDQLTNRFYISLKNFFFACKTLYLFLKNSKHKKGEGIYKHYKYYTCGNMAIFCTNLLRWNASILWLMSFRVRRNPISWVLNFRCGVHFLDSWVVLSTIYKPFSINIETEVFKKYPLES